MERMLREWEQALTRYRKRRGRNVDWDALEPIIQAQLEQLRKEASVDDLRRRFTAGNYWALQICRRLAPGQPGLWDLHYTSDVAYALRFVELTGQSEEEAIAGAEQGED